MIYITRIVNDKQTNIEITNEKTAILDEVGARGRSRFHNQNWLLVQPIDDL